MTEELCRAKFEEWWEEWFGDSPLSGWEMLWCGEGYSAEEIDHMWDAWQAAWNTRAEMEKSHDSLPRRADNA